MSKVVFRKWKEGEVIALFPDEPRSRHGHTTAVSYTHLTLPTN